MAKAYVKKGRIPDCGRPTRPVYVPLSEDTEMLLLKRAAGRQHRKLLDECAKTPKNSSDDGYKGENWDQIRMGSAQEEEGY